MIQLTGKHNPFSTKAIDLGLTDSLYFLYTGFSREFFVDEEMAERIVPTETRTYTVIS